jgi:type 2 lantibiotic biosynthesis protein LanM
VTQRDAVRDGQTSALPRWWWVRGLNLRERLAAPRPPAAGRPAAGAARPSPFTPGVRDGFAARLAALALSDDLAHALGEELPERIGARAPQPRWARFVEEAVSTAREEGGPSRSSAAAAAAAATATATESDAAAAAAAATNADAATDATSEDADSAGADAAAQGAAVFLPVLRPLIALAWAGAAGRLALPEDDHAPLRRAFEKRLGEQLIQQSVRVLVTELSRERTAGRLSGATPRDRFAAFTAHCATRQGLSGLFARYPVLARMLGQTAVDAADAVVELAARLHADRERLTAGLFAGVGPGALVRVELGRGDAHQGNRSVAVLHFEGGAVVYKPRPLDQHALLDEAVAWLDGLVPGLGPRTPRTVRGEGYGWLEFIEHRWCDSITAADRFYRRQGALLALLYVMDGTDVHYENLIACGDQPVLVDAETLLHSGLPFAMTVGDDPAARALAASVHRTGLLPYLLIGDNGAMDLSALGRTEGGQYPSDVLCLEGVGTDEMRVVRAPVAGATGLNQPLSGAHPAGQADHRAALLAGFRAGYEAIALHRDELLDEDGFLTRWSRFPARLLVRPTRLYTTLLEESTHPDLLRDALARDAVFALLWTESAGDGARQRLIEEEIADLWRGDVPVFFHRPAQTAVWTARDVRLDRVLPATSLRTVRDKIAALSEVDRYDQEWVIAATLAVGSAGAPSARTRSALVRQPASSVVPTSSRLLAAACGIADEIGARAVLGGGRANWLCLERVTDAHWAVMPMGGGLAEGYCGVALFLAQIGSLARADRYTALARDAVRPLPSLLSSLAGDPDLSAAVGPGALSGLGGIIYALVRLSALLGDEMGRCLPDAFTALTHATDGLTDHPLGGDAARAGLADGLAGALVAAVLLQETGFGDDAGKLARQVADRLLRVAGTDGARPAGLASGSAGIGWALLRYARTPAFADDARPHAEAGAALLRSALDTSLRAAGDLSWHSGLSGVLLASVDGLDTAGHPGADAAFDRCVRLLDAAAPASDLSLRQGTLGRLEPLIALAGRGHAGARAALPLRTGGVLGLIEQQGHRCATPDHVTSPGLLTGLAGIGYALLRLGFPETVPPVATFDHPVGAAAGR